MHPHLDLEIAVLLHHQEDHSPPTLTHRAHTLQMMGRDGLQEKPTSPGHPGRK